MKKKQMSPEMKKALDELGKTVRGELPRFIREVIIPWHEERCKIIKRVFGLNKNER